MPFNLPQSFDTEFCNLLRHLFRTYPEEVFLLEGIHPNQLDVHESSRSFFKKKEEEHSTTTTADVSVDPNANVSGKDVITYTFELPKPIMRLNSLYNLWRVMKYMNGTDYANTVIEAEVSGLIYINDSWDIGRPYCFNYSTLDIAKSGIPQMGRLNITRPKSLSSFLHQVEQFVVLAANSTLGATGMADILIVASWYVERILETGYDHKIQVFDKEKDYGVDQQKKTWDYVHELLIHLIYTLNFEFRGNQSPFTNVSVYDKYFLSQLVPNYELEGKAPNMHTVQIVQNLFLQAFNEELKRNPLTFPVVTACFSVSNDDKDRKIRDKEFLKNIAQHNLEFGFINIYCGKTSTLSSCCRLRSDASDLGYSNSFGSGSTKIGSLGVVTLNLPRIAKLSLLDKEEPDFEEFLKDVYADAFIAATVNHAKRLFIEDRIKRGALPLYTKGFMDLNRQYSTCGFTGLYEAVQLFEQNVSDAEGMELAVKILATINKANDTAAKFFGTPHNVEQVPAETSAVKLAKKDRAMHIFDEDDDMIPALYSNQFIPLWADGADIFTRVEVQGILDPYCTGGAIAHLNIAQKITSVDVMEKLISYTCSKGVIYFAVNYTINKCENNHMTVGHNVNECPICHKPITDTYTRVVGFLTNTKNWNQTRRENDWPKRSFSDFSGTY